MSAAERKPVAILLGVEREWFDFVRGLPPGDIDEHRRGERRVTMTSGTVYQGVLCHEDMQGRTFEKFFTHGTFSSRRDASKMIAHLRPRVR